MKIDRAKGTRDFAPEEKIVRDRVTSVLKEVFESYGFAPLDTPLIERYDVMTIKEGAGEGSDVVSEIFRVSDQGGRELGLRFELTFQLARFIAMNPEIKMPFKRYQMGQVFRDGPIKAGRYREFWQCDVDTIGSNSVWADAEIIALLADVFKRLDLDVTIQVNNRELLIELMNYAGISEDLQKGAIISIDKLAKIGRSGVLAEMQGRGIDEIAANKVLDVLDGGSMESIAAVLPESKGLASLKELDVALQAYNVDYEFVPGLARGLGYYTGTIFEVFCKDSSIMSSSLAGGGRYDNLVKQYGGPNMPAVGVGIGLEPIMEVIKNRDGLGSSSPAQLFLVAIGCDAQVVALAAQLRKQGVRVATNLARKGVSKNLDYADKMKIPFVAVIGENEVASQKLKLKNMQTGQEEEVAFDQLDKKLV